MRRLRIRRRAPFNLDPSFVRSKGYSWSADVESALDFIDQGSVIRGVPFVYAANGAFAIMPQTSVLDGQTGGVNLGQIDAMVTTQTCDIRGPGAKKTALLNVSPVLKVADLNPNLSPADVTASAYLVLVTGSAFSDEAYVVDLRFEAAVEKSIVVGREVVDGFSTSDDRNAFSKKLGEYRRRGAFDPKIESVLLYPLEALFNESISPDDVYEIRILGDPSISRADTARLIVICEPTSDVGNIHAIVSTWYDGQRETDSDLNLLPVLVKSTEEATVADIRGSVPVYFRRLSDDAPEA